MPINVIKARLKSLRNNLPRGDAEESVVREFNSMVSELVEELRDPEVDHFRVNEGNIKRLVVQVIPGRSVRYTNEKYCDQRIFKQQVEGLWEYLLDSQHIIGDNPVPREVTSLSPGIYIQGNVTGSTIQQGDGNSATLQYEGDVRKVVEEIRSLMSAARLTPDAKAELRADVETVEAQLKSPRPKHTIVREGLISARRILENAFSAAMAQTFFPLLIKFLEHHH